MGRDIIYDRRFIKINEDCFIPVIQHGCSNCWEYNIFTRREIPEKNWFNISKKIYCSKKELETIAVQYDANGCYKTRNTPFKHGEFSHWFLNGIQSAKTIEEYAHYGIQTIASVETHTNPEGKLVYEVTHISSNKQLGPSIQYLKDKLLKLGIDPEKTNITIGFNGRNCMKRLPKYKKEPAKITGTYWVLQNITIEVPYYLKMLTRTRNHLTSDIKDAKRFKTMAEAAKYIETHKDKLKGQKYWNIKCIENVDKNE